MIDRLTIKEIQDLIGEAQLERLKEILPFIPNSGLNHPNDIYEKEYLVKIFLSLQGQDLYKIDSGHFT